jgi:hypothetical protein
MSWRRRSFLTWETLAYPEPTVSSRHAAAHFLRGQALQRRPACSLM